MSMCHKSLYHIISAFVMLYRNLSSGHFQCTCIKCISFGDIPLMVSGLCTGTTSVMSQLVADKYRDVVKLNDYLTTGRRQQFWEEPFTRRIMEAIKSKELEMKAGAELLGVSYGTLYGRYRDAYGCLKHPYR